MKRFNLRFFLTEQEAIIWQFPGPILLIGIVLLRGEFIFWGTAYLQFLPWRWEAWMQILQGIFPLWTDKLGMGAPLFANYQSGFLYPLNIIIWLGAALGSIKGIAFSQTLLVMIHLILAGIGMVLFTRKIGFSKYAQILSGLAFSLSGYLLARASFLSMNATLIWIPWLLWLSTGWLQGMASGNRQIVFRFAIWHMLVFAIQLLGGHAQTTWYSCLLVFIWILTYAIWTKALQIWKILAIFLGVSILAAGISAIQLIPTAEYLIQTTRSTAVEEGYALNYSFWPWRLLSLVSPDLFGNPGRNSYWVTADNYWEDAIYAGFATAILAFAGLIKRNKKNWSGRLPSQLVYTFSLVLCAVGLLLALGRHTPVFPFLYRFIPTFNLFQGPARFMIWFTVGLILLAGIGYSRWEKPTGRSLYWSRLGAMAGFGAVLTSLAASLVLKNRVEQTYLQGAIHTSILFFLMALFNLLAPARGSDCVLWNRLFSLFLLADLMFAHWTLNPGMKLNQLDAFQNGQSGLAGSKRVFLPVSDEIQLKFERYFRFDTFLPMERWDSMPRVYLPNTNLLQQKPAISNFDPFVPARYAIWMKEVMGDPGLLTTELLPYLDIDMVESLNPGDGDVTLRSISGGSRFHFFSCAESAISDAEAVDLVIAKIRSGDLEKKVIITQSSTVEYSGCQPEVTKAQFDTRINQPDELKLQLITGQDGWFMQTDVWYPGWKAWLDGQLVPLERMDFLFRGIFVPKGSHTIVFRYEPVSFKTGVWISVLSLMIFIGILGFSRQRSKTEHGK